MTSLWDDLLGILREPFVKSLSISDLALITLIVMLAAAFWVFVLNHIRLAAAEVL